MITIVVGAQYGGEGKGKVCSYLGAARDYKYVCRTGGVNSSHAVKFRNHFHRLRMLPASAVVGSSTYLYGAGSLIHIETLKREMRSLGVRDDQVVIDRRAGIVSEECVQAQRQDQRYERIGSTLTGTGYATARRSMRELQLATDYPELALNLGDVSQVLYEANLEEMPVLVEGHQGAGLSNYHGDYPFTSSRDCTAAALLSEIGVGPRVNLDILLVAKLFPTRNHAGRLPNELSFEEATTLNIREKGGGSWGIPDRQRRVAEFDWEDLRRAIILNSPSGIALTGFDYRFPEARGAQRLEALSSDARHYLEEFRERAGLDIDIVSTGPDVYDTIAIADRFKLQNFSQGSRQAA